MTREFLEKLGLEKGVIDQIMTDYGKSVQTEKEKIATLEREAAAAKTQLEGLNKQIEERDADIENLKKNEGTAEALNGKIAELQTKYETDTAALNAKISEQAYEFAADKFFDGYRFSSKAARRAAMQDFKNSEGVKLVEGKFIGAKEFIDKYKEEDPDSFAPDENDGDKGGGDAGEDTPPPFPKFTPNDGGQGGGNDDSGGKGGFSFAGFNLVRPVPKNDNN